MTNRPAPLTARPRYRGELNRQEVLRRLTRASERLLARGKPFSEITIQQLAREAGIARSTFYAHFSDRAALLRAMTAVVFADAQEATLAALSLGVDATLDDFRAMMCGIVAAFGEHEPLLRPIFAASLQDPLAHAAHHAAVSRTIAAVEAFIRTQPPGHDRRDLEPHETATVLVRMVERTITEEATGGISAHQRDRLADALAQVAWHAVFTDAHPNP